jgi:hypothetical protein
LLYFVPIQGWVFNGTAALRDESCRCLCAFSCAFIQPADVKGLLEQGRMTRVRSGH